MLQVLKHIGPETIVTHEVSAETAGNMIGQRDFLSVRHSCKQKSGVYLGGAATQLESFPPQAGFVRYDDKQQGTNHTNIFDSTSNLCFSNSKLSE